MASGNELSNEYFLKEDEEIRSFFKDEILSQYFNECLIKGKENINKEEFTKKIEKILRSPTRFFQPFMIQPSLHYLIGSMATNVPSGSHVENPMWMGDETLYKLLNRTVKSGGAVITIRGPQGTFKTIIARSFLLYGLTISQSVLFIRLSERESFNPSSEHKWENAGKKSIKWGSQNNPNFTELVAKRINDSKRVYKVFKYQDDNSRIAELSLKSGALVPEEFIEFVRDIIRDNMKQHEIKRVVLSDVAAIGASYPFLRHSKTAGDLFLSTFVHLMKNYDIDLLMTGTTGLFAASDEIVNRASELADSVLITETCEVFGDRYITITGEGLNTSKDSVEYVPAVIAYNKDKSTFSLDLEKLQGLVGFDSKNIHRPGLTFHMFTQPGSIFKSYQKEIQELLEDSMASTILPGEKADSALVELKTFDSALSGPYHASLDVLKGKPINRTVIYMLDDFWKSEEKISHSLVDLTDNFDKILVTKINSGKTESLQQPARPTVDVNRIDKEYIISPRTKFDTASKSEGSQAGNPTNTDKSDNTSIFGVPFYNNVLLLVFRKTSKAIDGKTITYWKDVFDKGEAILMDMHKQSIELNGTNYDPCLFDCDTDVKETLSCLLLDAYIATDQNQKMTNDRRIFDRITDQNGYRSERDSEDGKTIKGLLLDHTGSIKNLLHISKLFKGMPSPNRQKEDSGRSFYPNAAVYICWYSQLRQLIDDYPFLSDKLDVAPLPGLGFRGDWYLGVDKGSVSLKLALDVIRILTSRAEEYNRFAKGIGLPTRYDFLIISEKQEGSKSSYDPHFFAWKNSGLHDIYAQKVFSIHYQAFTRSSIPGYMQFRRMLSVMMEEVIDISELTEDKIVKIVERIPHQIKIFDTI